jgi:hypothetical protein
MMKQIKKAAEAMQKDNMKLRRYTRGVLAWLGATALQMTAVGPDVMMTWTPKRWVMGFLASGIVGIVGLINLGEKNQTDSASTDQSKQPAP